RRRSSRFLKFQIPQCALLSLRSRSDFQSRCYSPGSTNLLPKESCGRKISIPYKRDRFNVPPDASSTSSLSGLCCWLLQCSLLDDSPLSNRRASRSLKRASQFCPLKI